MQITVEVSGYEAIALADAFIIALDTYSP